MMAEVSLAQLLLDKSYWALLWEVNIDPDNWLVPPGKKPLPEPMVTQIYVIIWCHQATQC